MKETYFIIRNSDGDTTVTTTSKEGLLSLFDDGDIKGDQVLTQIPDTDTNYWGDGVLIIKGSIVTPKAETVVTKYNID